MNDKKQLEIKGLFIDNIDLTAKEVMEWYIFGAYAKNEHYNINDIVTIKKIAYLELNPLPVVEEEVVEEEVI